MFWERCFVEEYYRKNVQNKMGGKSPGGATRGKPLYCPKFREVQKKRDKNKIKV